MSDLQPAPPRAPTSPAVPNPMTNMGVMSDYGAGSEYEEICDIKPDFNWLSSYEIFMDSFRFDSSKVVGTELTAIYPMSKAYNTADNHEPYPIRQILADWHFIPFLTSRWWSGSVRLRFMAIKPRQVTGRLLITWYPDVSEYDMEPNKDTLRRKIKYEWDLGESNEYSLLISGYNTTRLRPTWIPGTPFQSIPLKEGDVSACGILPPLANYTMGVLQVTVANPLQPGTLYPDSIRILVFHSFENTTFHTSVDIRGDSYHMFGVNGPPKWAAEAK